uniref:3'-5' exonuclease domain-containing protein n=1 Tax=Kalanchoe fedtschenkoi TaxID=63787 RepID=A0A7N0UH69_KALFE
MTGTQSGKKKCKVLQRGIFDALHNSPRPGPATFAVHCLHALSYLDKNEGFCRIVLGALDSFLSSGTVQADILQANIFAAYLFLGIVHEQVKLGFRVAVQLLEVVGFRLNDVERVICGMNATTTFAQCILQLARSKLNSLLVALVKHFSMSKFGMYIFLEMIQDKKLSKATEWATYLGERSMLHRLTNEYVNLNMLNEACSIILNNSLMPDFPDVCHLSEERLIFDLASEGLWKLAEDKAKSDSHLINYLVYLAMEAGLIEKVEELSYRYSLEGFESFREPVTISQSREHICLADFEVYETVWVDSVDGLHDATCQLEACKIVAVDSEWKELKMGRSNVCILQIASMEKVFIFDMMTLHNSAPDKLDSCLNRLLCSPSILKLGYNIKQDLQQLAYSFCHFRCSKHYRMFLDFQLLFPCVIGGLAGLTKVLLYGLIVWHLLYTEYFTSATFFYSCTSISHYTENSGS